MPSGGATMERSANSRRRPGSAELEHKAAERGSAQNCKAGCEPDRRDEIQVAVRIEIDKEGLKPPLRSPRHVGPRAVSTSYDSCVVLPGGKSSGADALAG